MAEQLSICVVMPASYQLVLGPINVDKQSLASPVLMVQKPPLVELMMVDPIGRFRMNQFKRAPIPESFCQAKKKNTTRMIKAQLSDQIADVFPDRILIIDLRDDLMTNIWACGWTSVVPLKVSPLLNMLFFIGVFWGHKILRQTH